MVDGASGANHRYPLDRLDPSAFPAADVVLCQLEMTDEVVSAAAAHPSGLFVVNAAPARPLPAEVADRADVVIVNQHEHQALASQLDRLSALVVVSLGAEGAVAYRDEIEVARAVPPSVEVVDTVGAGDAFVGCLSVELALGTDRTEALRRSCRAG